MDASLLPSLKTLVRDMSRTFASTCHFRVEEAAEATGYSTSTLRIAIRRHDLIARYAKTKPVILAEELLDWLRSLPTEPRGGHQPLSYLVRERPDRPDEWRTEPDRDPFG
jgi:hypothetical protein